MLRKFLLASLLMLLLACVSFSRGKIQGVAIFSQPVTTSGLNSSNKFPRVLSSATITVYSPTGSTTLATLYSDVTGTSRSNPFTAGLDGSYSFYTDSPSVDIRISGVTGVSPFTLGAIPVVSGQTVFDVRAFGATCDGSTNDKTFIQNTINAASITINGGIIKLPGKTCYLGTSAQGSLLRVSSPNISIYGDGIDISYLTYSSLGRTGGWGSGAAILAGDQFVNNTSDNFTVKDLTIKDLNTSTAYAGTGTSGLFAELVDNVLFERIKTINVKGNAGISAAGTVSLGLPASTSLTIIDCQVTGTSAGGRNDGDGINWGNYSQVKIIRPIIDNVLRNGIEGGDVASDILIDTPNINMNGLGVTGIATFSGVRMEVRGAVIRNAPNVAIDLTADANTYLIQFVRIINPQIINTITNTGAGGYIGIHFGPLAGSSSSILGPFEISGGYIKADYPIEFATATSARVHDIELNNFGLNAGMINGGNGSLPVIAATDLMQFYNITVKGCGTPPCKLIQWWDANWKVKRLKLSNITIGVTDAQGANGAIDGNLAVTLNPGLITAVAVSSATQTSTFTGAIVGDKIDVTTDTALPVGCMVVVQVTSLDTITWRVVNVSGADQTVGSTVFRFWLGRR